VILRSDKEDPILATWQYGLGRSVAFTSDATGRWARDWLGWEPFAAFWAQAVRYTVGSVSNRALETSVELQGEEARLTLDARNPNGDFVNGYQVAANIVGPDGESQSVNLRQIAPGRYEADFAPNEQGVYLIHFSGMAPDGTDSFAETTGWTLSYSPEYRRLESDPDLLVRLAAISGGKLASADPADAFTHDLQATRAARPIWQWLVLLAAFLLPFDIASRRLIITRQDLLRLRDWILVRLNFRRATAPMVAAQPTPRMQALLKAKDRAAESTKSPPQTAPTETRAPTQQPIVSEPAKTDQPVPEPEKASTQEPAPPERTTTSTTTSLLERKKALRKKRE
jgi:hypothetical protein